MLILGVTCGNVGFKTGCNAGVTCANTWGSLW